MGCCEVTYEEEMEKEIINYLKTLNISEETRRNLLQEIKEDIKKNPKNNNPKNVREMEKTVNYYKNYISLKLKSPGELNNLKEKEIKIETKKNDNNNNNNNNIITKKEEILVNNKEQPNLFSNNINNNNNINNSINTEIKEGNNNNIKKEEIKENQNHDILNKEEEKEKILKEETSEIKKDQNEIKEIKQVNEVKEEIKEEIKEDQPNWRELLKDNNNFSQDVPFDFKSIYNKLQKAAETPERLNPFYTLTAINDFTKIFKEISSALSMGFSDITDKCGKMRRKFEEYPNAKDIQDLLRTEMSLNIHRLNKDNNKKLGHGDDEYKDYVSACRTFLRLLWFLEYLTDIFENVLKDDGTGAIKTILGNSYDKVLAPHHTFVVKNAVKFALMFSSAGNVAKNVKIIFGFNEYNDEAKQVIQNTVNFMKTIWNGGNDFYVKNSLLDLE